MRSKKFIGALLAILAVVALFAFSQHGTAHAQTLTNDAVASTVSLDLAITGIDTDGVDTVRPPGITTAVEFPKTWTTIESTRNSVYANTVVDHPPGFAPAAIPSAWTNTFPLNSVGMNATSAGFRSVAPYAIVVNGSIVDDETIGAALAMAIAPNTNTTDAAIISAIAVNTHTGASADTPSSSALGTVIDTTDTTVAVADIVTLAMFAISFVLACMLVSSIARISGCSSRASYATTGRLTATNDRNNWLTPLLVVPDTVTATVMNAATRAGQAIKNAPRQLDVMAFNMRAAGHLGFPFA